MTKSILSYLPEYVTIEIRTFLEREAAAGHPLPHDLRDDLIVIPEAEAAGWFVSFRDDNWYNTAEFVRDGITVWQATGWRRAGVVNGLYTVPEVFSCEIEGLRAALASTTELVPWVPRGDVE
jgi:hypothetical protein